MPVTTGSHQASRSFPVVPAAVLGAGHRATSPDDKNIRAGLEGARDRRRVGYRSCDSSAPARARCSGGRAGPRPVAPEHEIPAVVADVSDSRSVERAVTEAVRLLGGLDILVNNAGIGAQGTVEDNDDQEWHKVLDVNVVGMARVTRAALPHLRLSSNAAIVNTCSIAATAGLPRRALYSASKGAVLSLTLAMAADHIREGIRVNCVNPGTVDTPWVATAARRGGRSRGRAHESRESPASRPSGHGRRGRSRDRLPRESERRLYHREWRSPSTAACRASVSRPVLRTRRTHNGTARIDE